MPIHHVKSHPSAGTPRNGVTEVRGVGRGVKNGGGYEP
jgi:hypothetical protein